MLYPQAGLTVGIDPDLISLRQHRVLEIPRACGLAECLPFSDNAFDLICCSWVLEHLPDPAAGFREVARVLAPAGHFIFVTPNRRHPLLALNRALRWTRGRLVDRLYGREAEDTFPAFYRANTQRQIDHWAGRAGMRRIAFHRIGDPTYLAFGEPLYRLACWLERLMPPTLRVHLVGDYALV
jgi:SAM-dependent methyltransferase